MYLTKFTSEAIWVYGKFFQIIKISLGLFGILSQLKLCVLNLFYFVGSFSPFLYMFAVCEKKVLNEATFNGSHSKVII